VRNSLAGELGGSDHWRECYVQQKIKSMKTEKMASLEQMAGVTSPYRSLTEGKDAVYPRNAWHGTRVGRQPGQAAQNPLRSLLCKYLNLRGHKIHRSAAHKQMYMGNGIRNFRVPA
jgi:hypothetical protein